MQFLSGIKWEGPKSYQISGEMAPHIYVEKCAKD